MEKEYRYDHKAANAPQATRPSSNPQDVNANIPQDDPKTTVDSDDQYTPKEYLDTLPKQRSMWPTYIGLLAIIGVLSFLIFRQRPQTFDACSRLPGSTVTTTDCTTFYGATFVKNTTTQDIELETSLPTTDTEPEEDYDIEISTTIPELDSLSESAKDESTDETTKGGEPIPTATPTPTKASDASAPTSTPKPVELGQAPDTSNTDGWVRHRYSKQKFTMMLPKGSDSSVVRDVQTNITTINTWTAGQSSTPYMIIRVQPNWDGTGDAKDRAINYNIDGHNGIKDSQVKKDVYYMEKDGMVWIFSCQHNGHAGSVHTCDNAMSSIDIY